MPSMKRPLRPKKQRSKPELPTDAGAKFADGFATAPTPHHHLFISIFPAHLRRRRTGPALPCATVPRHPTIIFRSSAARSPRGPAPPAPPNAAGSTAARALSEVGPKASRLRRYPRTNGGARGEEEPSGPGAPAPAIGRMGPSSRSCRRVPMADGEGRRPAPGGAHRSRRRGRGRGGAERGAAETAGEGQLRKEKRNVDWRRE